MVAVTDADAEYFSRIVDEESLRAYLTAELGPADRFEVSHHQEGHSNETLFVTWGERELVVRRPPPGETADNAHDVLREVVVLGAVGHRSSRTVDVTGRYIWWWSTVQSDLGRVGKRKVEPAVFP